ncbi:hypothetical protein DPMN_181447 [Dreissena polymorpha]|uniref:Uncharacterized protein n=1 Tax=Dreissena polymorpha TaxID=45954 RepID=A0A9D4I1N2_DREPO|nr:hypothetical protein DPMN_181447 [Dreissena polymorpha]
MDGRKYWLLVEEMNGRTDLRTNESTGYPTKERIESMMDGYREGTRYGRNALEGKTDANTEKRTGQSINAPAPKKISYITVRL